MATLNKVADVINHYLKIQFDQYFFKANQELEIFSPDICFGVKFSSFITVGYLTGSEMVLVKLLAYSDK